MDKEVPIEESASAAKEINDITLRNNFFDWLCAFKRKMKDHWDGNHTLLSPTYTHFKNVTDDHFLVCLLLRRPAFDRELFIDLRKLVSTYINKGTILSNMILSFDADTDNPCIYVEIEKIPKHRPVSLRNVGVLTSLSDIGKIIASNHSKELSEYIQILMKLLGSLHPSNPILDASISENHNDTYTLKVRGYSELFMDDLMRLYNEIGINEYTEETKVASFFVHQVTVFWLKETIELSVCIKQSIIITEENRQFDMSARKRKNNNNMQSIQAKKRFGVLSLN